MLCILALKRILPSCKSIDSQIPLQTQDYIFSELGIHGVMEKILEVHGCCPIIWLNSWPFQIHSHGIHGVLKFIITEFMAFSSSWSWNSWRFHIHSHRIHDILIFIVMESWLYNLVHMNMSCMTIFVGLKLFLDCYIVNKMAVETTFRIS